MQEWHVRTNPTKYPDLFTYTILEKNPDYVIGKPNRFKEFSVAFELDSKENAYLISAAPDMYQALKDLVNENDIAFLPVTIQEKIKLIIAKAGGK